MEGVGVWIVLALDVTSWIGRTPTAKLGTIRIGNRNLGRPRIRWSVSDTVRSMAQSSA